MLSIPLCVAIINLRLEIPSGSVLWLFVSLNTSVSNHHMQKEAASNFQDGLHAPVVHMDSPLSTVV